MPCFCTRRGRHRPTPGTSPHRPRAACRVRTAIAGGARRCGCCGWPHAGTGATSPRRMLGTGDVARGVGRPSGHADYYRPAPSGARCTPARLPHFHHCCLARSHRAGAGASHLVLLILNNSPDLEAEAPKGVRDGAAVAARLKACPDTRRAFRSFCRSIFPILLVCAAVSPTTPANPPRSAHADGYQIVHVYPHDPGAFTQGLVYVDGHLYESTGLKGRSSIRMVDLSTGRVLQRYDLPTEYFGEGLTTWGANLIQLTWKAETGFVYDRFSFALRRTFHYQAEGWGLTHDEKELILGDGTSVLRFLDPTSFREIKRISVHDDKGQPLKNLNELEYIHGEIYANIWQTDQIVRISPHTGKVLGWIDLSGLMDKRQRADPDAVLNGIAYDSKGDRLFVTGKLWPKLFEIRVVHDRSRVLGAARKNDALLARGGD